MSSSKEIQMLINNQEELLIPDDPMQAEVDYQSVLYPTAFIPEYKQTWTQLTKNKSTPTLMTLLKEMPSIPTVRLGLMEFLGVFLLMFIGNLATVENSSTNNTHTSNTAFVAVMWGSLFFLIIRTLPGVVLIPWVSLYNWFFAHKADQERPTEGKLTYRSENITFHYVLSRLPRVLFIVVCQFAGGLVASIVLYLVQNRNADRIGETVPSSRISDDTQIIGYEFTAAFIFIMMVNLFSPPRKITPIQQAGYISFTVFILYMAFGDLTGCGLSWVRTFGPAAMRGMAGHEWKANTAYYLVGQIVGFSSAGIIVHLYRVFKRNYIESNSKK